MKRLFTLLPVIALVLCPGCRQRDIREAEIKVPDVYNRVCEDHVRKALLPLKGIESDTIVFEDGVLRLSYDSMQLALKNIEHAIKDAGFTANGFSADPQARAKLPKECQERMTR